jgi:hypothetical protein
MFLRTAFGERRRALEANAGTALSNLALPYFAQSDWARAARLLAQENERHRSLRRARHSRRAKP